MEVLALNASNLQVTVRKGMIVGIMIVTSSSKSEGCLDPFVAA
jgi:hypothetical protein